MSEAKDVFENIYKNNLWNDKESVSGPGSSLKNTKNIRRVLPKLIKTYKIKSITDIPCGDMYWFSKIELNNIKYFGFDIVDEIIEKNKENYKGNKKLHFEVKDAIKDKLPKTDLILCRDLIIHLPINCIWELLNNFVQSGSKYLLITQHILMCDGYKMNDDIQMGNFAFRNLTLEPFNFPQADFLIFEEEESKFYARFLAFYDLKTIKDCL